jgi:hypothetical protein
MGEVDPAAERDKVQTRRVALGRVGVGRPDEMRCCRRCRGMNVDWQMVLEPKMLIDGVVTYV